MELFPDEFYSGQYTHQTDMFCVAELLNRLIKKNSILDFNYQKVLNKMMQIDLLKRYKNFDEALEAINKKELELFDIPEKDKKIYQNFSEAINEKLKYFLEKPILNTDVNTLIKDLEIVIKENSFENYIQDNSKLISLFVKGGFRYTSTRNVDLEIIKVFYFWFKELTIDLQNIIIQNINLKLAKTEVKEPDVELPF